MNAIQREASRYIKARKVLEELRRNDRYLTYAEYRALRKKALEGDLDGAIKELGTILSIRKVYSNVSENDA